MAVKVPPLLHKMSANAQKAWYKKHGMEMPAKEKSAATAGKMKAPEPKKTSAAVSNKPKTAREISMERQKAYYAKGGRQPIGAGGSGGHSSMAGVGQSSAKEIIKGIRAGVNPKSRGIGEEASPMIKPPTNRFDKKSDAFAHAEKHGGKVYKQTYTDSKGQQTVSYSIKKEEVSLEEGKMKDIATGRQETERLKAQDVLGGKVKTRTGNEPKGKLPLGFRSARNLARKAMKAGTTVTESTTEVNNMSYGKKLAKSIMAKQSKHPIAQQMGEAVKDAADVGEYDYEGDMAKSQLRSILTHAKRLHDMLDDQTNLPEWVQSKITLAQDYVLTAADYMEGEMNEGYGGKFPKEWQKEMEKIPSTSTVVHKDKTVVTTKKDGKVVNVKTTKNEEVEQVDEKIDLEKAKMGDVIKDFQKSDAPQFKGKSMEKRREMAIAAKLGAERGMKEEAEPVTEKYMGFKAVMAAAKKGGARDPAAVAAAIGRKKYGKEKFQAMAAAGKKANEEVEHVTEAEGTVAVTPKEKALAAHHGDPKKITYGDVIKARLKSAAAKKMGK